MFCEKCGAEMLDDDVFCAACGWKVSEAGVPAAGGNPAPEAGAAGYGGYVPPQPPMKKKLRLPKLSLPILIGAAAVVLIVLVAALNWAALGNFAKKTFSSPEKYYQWVEKNTAEDAAAMAANVYSSYLLESLNVRDMGGSVSVNLKLGEGGQDAVDTLAGFAGLGGMDMSWLEDVTFSGEWGSKDNVLQGILGLTIGKTQLLSLDAIVDVEGEAAYLAIPELSSKYIGVEADEIGDLEYALEYAGEYTESMEALVKALPDQKQLEKLMKKYMETALGSVEDVKMKKGKDLKAEGISQKCTVLEVTLDADALEDMLKAVLEKMEDDKDLEKMVVKAWDALSEIDGIYLYDMDGDDAWEEIQKECKAAKRDIDLSSDFELVMKVYVDGKGNIRGRSFVYSDRYNDEVTVELLNPHKGSKFGYRLAASGSGNEIALTGTGKESGGTVTGDFVFEGAINGRSAEVLEVHAEEFDVDALKQGELKGMFTLKAASGLKMLSTLYGRYGDYDEASSLLLSALEDLEVSLNIEAGSKAATIGFGLASDGESLGSLTVVAERFSGKKISVPSGKNAVMVEDMDDFEDYWDSVKWDTVIKSLGKTALPEEIADILEDVSDMDFDEFVEWIYYGGFAEDVMRMVPLYYYGSSADAPTSGYGY